MKRVVKIIQGIEYDYVLCPRCKVWIQEKDYKNNTHINCDKYYKNLPIRKRAEEKALGISEQNYELFASFASLGGWTKEDELKKHYGDKNG